MKTRKLTALIFVFLLLIVLIFFFLPLKKAFTFTEYRAEHAKTHYVQVEKEQAFQIRYVHTIHLSDVIESYEMTSEGKIRFLSMQYEDVAIGLPGYAEKGETLSVKDGLYTLSFDDTVIDSFTMIIGDVDTDLAFRYRGNEIDLKKYLERGKSYTFAVKRLSLYESLKGDNMYGKR